MWGLRVIGFFFLLCQHYPFLPFLRGGWPVAGAAGQLTPTPGPTHPCFERTSTSIIGNNQLALAACKEAGGSMAEHG